MLMNMIDRFGSGMKHGSAAPGLVLCKRESLLSNTEGILERRFFLSTIHIHMLCQVSCDAIVVEKLE